MSLFDCSRSSTLGSAFESGFQIGYLVGSSIFLLSHIHTLLVKKALVIRAHLDQSQISTLISPDYWRVRVLEEVSSTQDELKNELVSSGDCVAAEFQSAG